MQNNNEMEAMKLGLGLTVVGFVIAAVIFAGIILAMLAVVGFVLAEWSKVLRYEGNKPVLWLLGATAVFALGCIPAAFEQMALFNYALDRNSDDAFGYLLGGIAYVAAIALPTAGYWLYRAIVPLSHYRINIIEGIHGAYANSKITRKQRDQELDIIMNMTDDALEEAMTRPQEPKQVHGSSGSAFDVPEQA